MPIRVRLELFFRAEFKSSLTLIGTISISLIDIGISQRTLIGVNSIFRTLPKKVSLVVLPGRSRMSFCS